MALLVFVICILLSVCSTTQGQGDVIPTTPPPMTFDCVGGKITTIQESNININSVLIDIKNDGTLCHYSDDTCKWQQNQILRVIYEPDEKAKTSKFVAGKIYRYILECKTGYLAQASVTAFQTNSFNTRPYYHQNVTVKPPLHAITIQIFKKGETSPLTDAVFVGDKLELKITGPASTSLKPVKCVAYEHNNIDKKYTLWDNSACTSHDTAIMASIWNTVDDHTIKIDMFAFRFVDALSIIIECSAYVCPLHDTSCGASINNCMTTVAPTTEASTAIKQIIPNQPAITPKPVRRRRSMDRHNYKEKSASTSFTVVDSDSNSNGCAGLSSNIILYFTTVICCWFIFGRDDSNH